MPWLVMKLAKLQLTGAQEAPVELPLLQGHLKANVICIDKNLLVPRLLPAEVLPLFIQPLTDLTINIDTATQIAGRFTLGT